MEQVRSLELIIVITTCGSESEAKRLARLMVNKRLAACAQISGPVTSFYWWKENMEEDAEWQVKFKMPAKNLEKAITLIREHHSYDLPQILALRIDWTLAEYADWILAESTGGECKNS